MESKHSIQLSKQHTSQIQPSFSWNRANMEASCKNNNEHQTLKPNYFQHTQSFSLVQSLK
jgi:hypothetical protein